MLSWRDLNHRLTRRRPVETENREGEVVRGRDAEPAQTIQGWLQPKRGDLQNQPEGVKAKSDHVFYCRMTVAPGSKERVDVKEGETLKDEATGKLYRVVFVSDEGGVGDHYKIYLLLRERTCPARPGN